MRDMFEKPTEMDGQKTSTGRCATGCRENENLGARAGFGICRRTGGKSTITDNRTRGLTAASERAPPPPNGGVANVFNLPINLIGNNANQVNLFPVSSPYFLGTAQEVSAGIERFTPIFSHRIGGNSAPRRPDGKTQARVLALPENLPCARGNPRACGAVFDWGGREERLRLRAAASACAADAGFRTATGKCPKIPAGPPRARRS